MLDFQVYILEPNNETNKIDITELVDFPLNIRTTIDETFDSGNISMSLCPTTFNNINLSKPLPKWTKIQIFVNNKKFNFYVADDSVDKNITNDLYNHNITLIEPTVILQNRNTPDITVTQPKGKYNYDFSYLTQDPQYLISTPGSRNLSFSREINSETFIELVEESPSTNRTIIDGTTLKEENRTYYITANYSLLNFQLTYSVWSGFLTTKKISGSQDVEISIYVNNVYQDSEIITIPAATEVRGGGYSYVTPGQANNTLNIEYTTGGLENNSDISIKVKPLSTYKDNTSIFYIDDLDVTISTKMKALEDKYTTSYIDLINKLLSIQILNDINNDDNTPEFILGEKTRIELEKYPNPLTPEFTFTGYNLWQSLYEIASSVKAIPRLGRDEFNILEFDFIDDIINNKFESDEFIAQTESSYLENFNTALEINAENIVETENSLYSKVEPFEGGWLSVRHETGEGGQLDESTASIIVRQPIYKILKVELTNITGVWNDDSVITTSKVIDITDYILESKSWNSLRNIDVNNKAARDIGAISKANTLQYSQGSNKITGFDHTALYNGFEKTTSALDEAIKTALQYEETSNNGTREIVSVDTYENYKGVLFRITYIPLSSIRARIYKENRQDYFTDSFSFVNETARINDATKLGNYVQSLVNRNGNNKMERTNIVTYDDNDELNFNNIPDVGNITFDDLIITSVNNTLYNNYIEFNYEANENYSAISDFVGIDSRYRQYQIPDTEVVDRRDIYEDFIQISTDLSEPDHTVLKYDGLIALLYNFSTDTSTDGLSTYIPSSYCRMQIRINPDNPGSSTWDTFPDDGIYNTDIGVSVQTLAEGTTSILGIEMKDNYSAGDSIITKEGYTTISLLQNDIEYITRSTSTFDYGDDYSYGDDLGKFDSARITFFNHGPKTEIRNTAVSNSLLYPQYVAGNGDAYIEFDVKVLKDARERYCLNYQLSFFASKNNNEEDDVRVFPGFAKYNGMMSKKENLEFEMHLLKDNYFPNKESEKINPRKTLKTNYVSNYNTNAINLKPYAYLSNRLEIPANSTFNGYALVKKDTGELIYSVKMPLENSTANPIYTTGTEKGSIIYLMTRKRNKLYKM